MLKHYMTLQDIRGATSSYLRSLLKEDLDVYVHDMIDKELYIREHRRSIT